LPLLKLSTEIDFFVQVSAKHLLSASVMSAPAALAMAKLSYPETKVSIAMGKDVYTMEKG
jgi:nucleoside permease NupC